MEPIGEGKICNFLKSENFQNSFCKKRVEIINGNYSRKIFFWLSWCIKDLWGIKVMYRYVVKWPVFSLQRGLAKSLLAPSSQDLLALSNKFIFYYHKCFTHHSNKLEIFLVWPKFKQNQMQTSKLANANYRNKVVCTSL